MARISNAGKKRGQKMRRDKRERLREKQEMREQNRISEKLQVTEFITVQELANLMDKEPAEVITVCMNVGIFAGINQRLEKPKTCSLALPSLPSWDTWTTVKPPCSTTSANQT